MLAFTGKWRCVVNQFKNMYPEDMPPIELTKLHFSEIKQDICVQFGVISSENHIALQCSNNQLIILDILDSSAVLTDLPYNLYYVEIPQNHVFDSLKKADLKKSYNNCNSLEQQRLTLDSAYVSHFSYESPKTSALQFKRAPCHSPKEHPIAVIVTVNGLCRILRKMAAPSRQWSEICNVNEYLSNETLSLEFKASKSAIECCITAAAWHKTEPLLFVSFDNGYVAIIMFHNAYIVKLGQFFITETKLEKICDIISFEHYVLVSCKDGILQLFYLHKSTSNLPLLSPMDALWKKRDNMACSKVLVNKLTSSTYQVVFSKGSHILVYMLNAKGKVLCSKELSFGGIKVTDVQNISSSEFIVTTITSSVHYFKVNVVDDYALRITKKSIEVDLDTSNLGILALVPSSNCSLLTFILVRSSEYSQQSKYMHSSVFVNISKLERIDILKQLTNPNLGAMNPNYDLLIALGMDTFSNMNYDKYSSFFEVVNTKLPDLLDNGFLLQLQIKFVFISNFLSFQRVMQKKNKEATIITHEFLSIAIQITHIICRLKYLFSLEPEILSSFQQESINLFMKKYIILIRKFKRFLTNKHILERTGEMYLSFFTKSYNAFKTYRESCTRWNERCLYCKEPTNADTMMCDNNHKVKRCYVSYTQLPIISSRHCPRCQYYILENKYLLQQLFPANEALICTFCRFLLIKDCI
ncbi:uncharacterized protein LOC129243131 isoform X1 [Anastrepha obliqua]|uniref:uncharacterized protein LOC129243131 isoform X1 n=2 Tax=Anastrepha obliqua TaxID=95512 RepID=UPI002409E938|nr:uncharacterized protein LOC129243131 isoform X1 [Anastrepha obliqua]